MNKNGEGNAFLSHSSKDKHFVARLANDLGSSGINVWYDEWAIDYGESIVEKIFKGLSESDFLIVVLSEHSIISNWVREELNIITMKKLNGRNIRIIPLILDDSEIPDHLSHLKYIDFRKEVDYEESAAKLKRTLLPAEELWNTLGVIRDEFLENTDMILNSNITDPVGEIPRKLYDLLNKALDLRVKIEVLHTRLPKELTDKKFSEDTELFKNIGYLFENGVDVRSAVWHALVSYNSMLAHAASPDLEMGIFVEMLDENGYFAQSWRIGMIRAPIFQDDYDAIKTKKDGIPVAVKELNAIAEMLCKKKFQKREFYAPRN